MTSNARARDRILGSLRSADGKGVVRIEDRLDTPAGDVWPALTDPGRLAGWLGEVEGDLRLGGEFRARFFASGWEGTGRVEACEPPQRLLVLTRDADEPDAPHEHTIEVTLTAEGDHTILAWEERRFLSTSSPPTEPGCRSTSKILPPIWPGVSAAMLQPGSTGSSPPIESWPQAATATRRPGHRGFRR